MDWNGMEWNGLEWNGMEWNGMEWNGILFYHEFLKGTDCLSPTSPHRASDPNPPDLDPPDLDHSPDLDP